MDTLYKYIIFILFTCRTREEEGSQAEVHQEALELPQEVCGVLHTVDPAGGVESLTPVPHATSTVMLVDATEAQHLEKKRKLEITLLEKQIEAEERRIQAFAAMQSYFNKLTNK